MNASERRSLRSVNTTRALCYQLGASLQRASLQGMVLTDEYGLCLATAGDNQACDEVAAHLPVMGRKVDSFEGVLFGAHSQWNIQMKRFEVEGSNLYLCAIGDATSRDAHIEHSISGVARILRPIDPSQAHN